MSSNGANEDRLDDYEEGDSLGDMLSEGFINFPWFLIILVIIGFLMVNSDIFSEHVLSRIPDAIAQNEVTTWGTLIQAVTQAAFIFTGLIARNML